MVEKCGVPARYVCSFVLLLVVLLLAGCELELPTPTPTSPPTLAPSPTVNPALPTSDPNPHLGVIVGEAASAPSDGALNSAVPPPDEPFTITASSDGIQLHGTLYRAVQEPAPAVLLLHMLNGRKEDWDAAVGPLQAAGYTVLAMDMRGHGLTGGAQNWGFAPADTADMLLALQRIDGVQEQRVGVIGASIGANLALVGCAGHGFCQTVVLLSPGLDYRGVTTEGAVTQLGDRPLLIAASENDNYAAESSRTLDGLASGAHQLVMYSGAAHGTAIFAAQPDLVTTILDWLNTHL